MIKNPEISALVPTLLKGLSDPNEYTKYSLDILLQVSFIACMLLILFSVLFCCLNSIGWLQTTFVNSIDAPSLALLVPIVHRGLRERSADTKKRASQIVGNMCSLVTEPTDMIPYIGLLLPEVKKVLLYDSFYVSWFGLVLSHFTYVYIMIHESRFLLILSLKFDQLLLEPLDPLLEEWEKKTSLILSRGCLTH